MGETVDEIRRIFASTRFQTGSNFYNITSMNPDFPAWVVRLASGKYGVAIEYNGDPIEEDFNGVSLYSDELIVNERHRSVLILVSEKEDSREQFAVFCYSLVDPGNHGELRQLIKEDPFAWWKQWKELVGNSAVNRKPYAVIGELLVLKQLLEAGRKPVWTGPQGGTRDIETKEADYEIKSTLNRFGKSIKISSQFQLSDIKELYLVFNRFEKSMEGYSINSLVTYICDRFEGWNDILEKYLRKLGYKYGNNSRNEKYHLLEQKLYVVNENFPHIDQTSFTDGEIPFGITKIEYTVELDSCPNCFVCDGIK